MFFTNEYEYLLHLICSAIHGTVPEDISEGLSFEKVLEYGITHEVANIAFLAVEKLKNPPSECIYNRWRQVYWQAIKRDTAQKKARNEILTALHSHGICTLEVQGTVVKQYYPQEHLRMMSDIDFIIPAEKINEAKDIMHNIGYEVECVHGDTEISAKKNNIFVELHTEYFDSIRSVYKILNHPFSNAEVNDDFTAVLTDTDFYLFHLLHTIKHAIEYKGIGIRRIVDLYYLENALKNKIDYSYIDGVLKKNKLYDTKATLLAVKDHWFCGIAPCADVYEFEKEILESGNQGTDEIYYRNMFKQERAKGKHFVKIRYVLNFLFPPKEDIYKSYPFCKKHRLPIVICWIHRWIFSVFNVKKWNNVKKVISNAGVKIK